MSKPKPKPRAKAKASSPSHGCPWRGAGGGRGRNGRIREDGAGLQTNDCSASQQEVFPQSKAAGTQSINHKPHGTMKKFKIPDAMKNPAPLEAPTPLELAHLSAALVQAGIVEKISTRTRTDEESFRLVFLSEPAPADASIIFASTLQYLEASHCALAKWNYSRKHAFVIEEITMPMQRLLGEFEGDKSIPVNRMVNILQAHRIKPSAIELADIGESRPWENLSKDEKVSSIFLALTNKPSFKMKHVRFPITTRRNWITNGIPKEHAQIIHSDMHYSQTNRAKEKGKEGAEKKRRKPGPPRGERGQFREKKRGSEGTFKKYK